MMERVRAGWLAAVLGAAALAAVAGSTSVEHAAALTNCTVSSEALDAQESAFLTLINNYRAQNGRSALKVSTNLSRASAWMAGDMGAKKYFSHTDSLGRSPSTRAQNCGYPAGSGENIAAGTAWDTAQEAFDAWKNSSGHNANMLNSSYKMIGIARVYTSGSPYGYYWVTNFGTVDDGTGSGGGATPPATATATATPSKTATPTATPPKTATPTATASPTVTAAPTTPAAAAAAKLSSPISGSRLTTSYNRFAWNAVSGAIQYRLEFGTSKGSANLGTLNTTATAMYISGVPRGYANIYVRLWTRTSAGWAYTDSTFRGP